MNEKVLFPQLLCVLLGCTGDQNRELKIGIQADCLLADLTASSLGFFRNVKL